MLDVCSISKKYNQTYAVKDVSFHVDEGEIVGFLGPNGAGKSTTMNIITGYTTATSGHVILGGYDTREDSVRSRALIGYLPEQPPLYFEMTVREYLDFVCRIKGAGSVKKQTEYVAETAKITHVLDRIIGNLSKGYRQRVGLAQALIGDPKILLLDEPTVGLDPQQITDMRGLISSLGEKHTVMLSSHILSEIQSVCKRVIIMNKGTIIADGAVEELSDAAFESTRIRLVALGSEKDIGRIVEGIEGIDSFSIEADLKETKCVIRPQKGIDIRENIFRSFAKANIPLAEIHRHDPDLEEVFLKLTQEKKEAAENEK